MCIGLTIGTSVGYFIGAWIARPYYPNPVMKAIACLAYKEPDVCMMQGNKKNELKTSLENFFLLLQNVTPTLVKVPSLYSNTDILIRVRAASIHRIDEQIANGYGKNLRRMIQNYNTYDHQELPMVIGRAAAGVVEGIYLFKVYIF